MFELASLATDVSTSSAQSIVRLSRKTRGQILLTSRLVSKPVIETSAEKVETYITTSACTHYTPIAILYHNIVGYVPVACTRSYCKDGFCLFRKNRLNRNVWRRSELIMISNYSRAFHRCIILSLV